MGRKSTLGVGNSTEVDDDTLGAEGPAAELTSVAGEDINQTPGSRVSTARGKSKQKSKKTKKTLNTTANVNEDGGIVRATAGRAARTSGRAWTSRGSEGLVYYEIIDYIINTPSRGSKEERMGILCW